MNFKKKKKIADKIYERMSNKIRQGEKTLISIFSVIFDNNHGSLSLEGRLDIKLGLHQFSRCFQYLSL